MKQKLNFQMIILTLCIALPVLALITYVGIRNNRAQLDEQLLEEESDVRIIVSQVDAMLDLLENSLSYLSFDDAQIMRIANAESQDTQFWMDNNAVMQKLKNQTMINQLNFNTFIYYPTQDIFYNSETDPEFTELIKALIAESSDSSFSGDWQMIECSGQEYLYILLDYKNYYIGAFARLEEFYPDLDSTDTQKYFFCRTSAEIESKEYGQDWYQVSFESTCADFCLVKIVHKTVIEQYMTNVLVYILVIAGIFAILLLAYIICLNIWILKPMNHLQKSMRIIQDGNLQYRIPQLRAASEEYDSVILEFNHLMDNIEELKISIYEQELEQKEVRLEYLNRQIQPHFILNTLNTLYNYSEKDTETVRKMIQLISKYYRYVVNVNSQYVELGQELEHIDNYLSLQKIRYPGLFVYNVQSDEKLRKTKVPPFILESFIENSFKHGLIPNEENKISINAYIADEDNICIRIEDCGAGFSDDSLDAIEEFLGKNIVSEELGVGVRNSIERLQLIYKENCSLRFFNKESHGAVIEIYLKQEISGKEKADENPCNGN